MNMSFRIPSTQTIEATSFNSVAVACFVLCLGSGILATGITHSGAPAIVGAAVGVYLLFAIKVMRQWEKVALLRLGRYVGLRGPGLFMIVPIVETISPYVDQ